MGTCMPPFVFGRFIVFDRLYRENNFTEIIHSVRLDPKSILLLIKLSLHCFDKLKIHEDK